MKTLLVAVVAVVATVLQSERPAPPELGRGQTVIVGTYMWDVESNTQRRSATNDVFWEQVGSGVQNLVPQHSAGLGIVKDLPFDKVTRDDLKALPMFGAAVPHTSLKPGTVLGLRTMEGNFAKLKVVGYRSSHDFSFDSAKLIPPEQQARLRARSIIESRHLEVSWVLHGK